MQNEASEAVQIEEQALVSDRVNQDPSDTHLPATAWPRQMLAAFTARPLRAKPSTGNSGHKHGRFFALGWDTSRYTGGGQEYGQLFALSRDCPGTHVKGVGGPRPSRGLPQSWWYRLGCRVPTYDSGVRGRDPLGEEITEQVISRGKG